MTDSTSIPHLIFDAITVFGRAEPRPRDLVIDEPMPPEKRLTGIDVSKHQGRIDWRRVAEDHTFAYVKATEGVGYVDPYFERNAEQAGDTGLMLGAYHFGTWHNMNRARPREDAQAEAECFLREIYGPGLDCSGALPPVLDLEWTTKEDKDNRIPAELIVEWALAWLEYIETEVGMTPMIYTGPWFMRRLRNPPELHRFPLWMARYTRRKNPTMQIDGWPWTFWQWTGSGRTAGVEGKVDLNVFAGSMEDLRAFVGLPSEGKIS